MTVAYGTFDDLTLYSLPAGRSATVTFRFINHRLALLAADLLARAQAIRIADDRHVRFRLAPEAPEFELAMNGTATLHRAIDNAELRVPSDQVGYREIAPAGLADNIREKAIDLCPVSPDGRWLARTEEQLYAVRVWDSTTGTAVTPVLWHPADVARMWFEDDSCHLRVRTKTASEYRWLVCVPDDDIWAQSSRALSGIGNTSLTDYLSSRKAFLSNPAVRVLGISAALPWER